jgi:hypothetical protein
MSSERSYSHEALRGLSNYVESALKRGIICCPNCDNFDSFGEKCKLNHLRPPAPIIAFGCERFNWNDCPF